MLAAVAPSTSTMSHAPWLPNSPSVTLVSTTQPPGIGNAYFGCHRPTLPGGALRDVGVDVPMKNVSGRRNDRKFAMPIWSLSSFVTVRPATDGCGDGANAAASPA